MSWNRLKPSWSAGQQDSETLFYVSNTVWDLYDRWVDNPFGDDDREAWSFAEIACQVFYMKHGSTNHVPSYWDENDYIDAIRRFCCLLGEVAPETIGECLDMDDLAKAAHHLQRAMYAPPEKPKTRRVEVEVTNTEVFYLTVEVPANATEEEIEEAAESMWTQMDQEELSRHYVDTHDREYRVVE